ncbi:alpha/beta hydrolase [Streptomyces hoynatensis]|uniref:Alpha/beta hydrolase n=1 Tax=Streptomyces hoynatensis TaxID=1141874 RepID=A0A3A9Z6W5_9ACTN|nr:alpha/beta hydrolase [Streptomyces hoynatensis]RKN43047.1 alpha/beta hydrolase [Streptomyces hoynatensis]
MRKPVLALCTATALLAGAVGCSSDDRPDQRAPSESPSGSEQTPPPEAPDAPVLEALPEEIPAELDPYYEQQLSWQPCEAGFECATMRVPLDYENVDPDQDLELTVTRSQATDPSSRIGSLLVNPGGPGASAVDFAQDSASYIFSSEVTSHYDVVAVDPRGTGASEPVQCMSGEQMDEFTLNDRTPDSQDEIDTLLSSFDEFAASCAEHSGDLLGHISTIESARDMDVLRALLGDDQLHYVGFSYGTKLGAVYAGLFPQRVGRLVLDGAIDPRFPTLDTDRQQAGGFETAFRSFAEDCASRPDCPLGTQGGDDASQRLLDFFEQVDAEPLPTSDPDRPLTESLASTGVSMAMYSDYMWEQLREALRAAISQGNGDQLLALADEYNSREPDGSYGTDMFAFPAISCLDSPAGNATEDEVEENLPAYEEASPTFGRDFAWATLQCAAWPVEPTGAPVTIEAEGANDIVVVGTTRDPATPYSWAQGLADQLSSGVLLTYDGDGHTAYGGTSPCIDAAVNAYLLEGQTPEEGTTC